ncbi:MAG TPA: hypothetical protein VNV38_17590 [Stellaceae bacterium]|jgi:hypothetical protein|nr:hypothetical protein [Stellaceae bacterium]
MNRVTISYDGRFTWLLDGEIVGPTRTFSTLPQAIACARQLTDASETMIELQVSGFYACVHQERGWPRRVHAPERAA